MVITGTHSRGPNRADGPAQLTPQSNLLSILSFLALAVFLSEGLSSFGSDRKPPISS